MDFMKRFLRAFALTPGMVQGVEGLFGEKCGEKKKAAVLELLGEAIDVKSAVDEGQIADEAKFSEGLGTIVDGLVMCWNASLWAKK